MKRLGMLLAALSLVACEAAGTGYLKSRHQHKPVAFDWQRSAADAGSMTATFGNGRVFQGVYLLVSDDMAAERLAPLWDGWTKADRRGSFRYWERDPGRKFFEAYQGRVLANLHASDGEHLRCRFSLNSPSRGVASGGDGRCQLSDSPDEIRVDLPRKPAS